MDSFSSLLKGGRGTKSKPVPRSASRQRILTTAPNVNVALIHFQGNRKRNSSDHLERDIFSRPDHVNDRFAHDVVADNRSASAAAFRLVYNPAADIPTEPNVGIRWLDEEEFLRLYRWFECHDASVHPTSPGLRNDARPRRDASSGNCASLMISPVASRWC
jgi:hypothetical protein